MSHRAHPFWECPGGLVVRVPGFHRCGLGSISGRGAEIPQSPGQKQDSPSWLQWGCDPLSGGWAGWSGPRGWPLLQALTTPGLDGQEEGMSLLREPRESWHR